MTKENVDICDAFYLNFNIPHFISRTSRSQIL